LPDLRTYPIYLTLTRVFLRSKGSVVLSGFLNAARLASSAAGTPLQEQRILFFGAGSAGIGVAKQLMSFFTLLGINEEEARSRIYVSRFPRLTFHVNFILIFEFRPLIPRVLSLLIEKVCKNTRNVRKAWIVTLADFIDYAP